MFNSGCDVAVVEVNSNAVNFEGTLRNSGIFRDVVNAGERGKLVDISTWSESADILYIGSESGFLCKVSITCFNFYIKIGAGVELFNFNFAIGGNRGVEPDGINL
ncbi:unknown [Clostridium sp. CAG:306]|nr:unknown [Clostridium sp. CAG:306]